MLKIIDVSQHQGRIDWARVKPYIDGAIIRTGYGSDEPDQADKRFEQNYAEVTRLKIPFEYYHYSYARNAAMARSEAAHALRLLKGKQVRRVWYDLEEKKCGSAAKEVMRVFAQAMKAAGYEVGLYSYESYYNTYLRGVTEYPIWIARYMANAPSIGTNYIAWQYTSAAVLPGITENTVDASHWYGAFAEEIREEKPKNGQTTVHRLYQKHRHFYTVDEAEKDMLIADGWTYEGIAWKATKNGHPVYRYVKAGEHIWTMDAREREALQKSGWRKEGIAWRSHVKEIVPVYRLYDPKTLDRVFTKLKSERKALIKAGWNDEGVAFYGRT